MALLKTLRIDRKFWGRGDTGGCLLGEKTHLEDLSTKMCCLGFYAIACGLSKKAIRGVGMPIDVKNAAKPRNKEAWQHMLKHRDIADSLASTNDDSYVTDTRKESLIKKGFAKLGVKVRFVGKG